MQDGIEIFDRLWDTSVFLFAHPADWGEPETLLITQAMLKGRILSDGFHPSRLVSRSLIYSWGLIGQGSDTLPLVLLKRACSYSVLCSTSREGTSFEMACSAYFLLFGLWSCHRLLRFSHCQ